MKSFFKLTFAVLRLYLRDPLTVALSLALIVFMMVLFGVVMGEEQFQVTLPLAIVDEADNPASNALLTMIEQDDLLAPAEVASGAAVDEEIRRAQVIGGLVLTSAFTGTPNAEGVLEGIRVVVDDDSTKWVRLGLERLQTLIHRHSGSASPASWQTVEREIEVVRSHYIDFIFPGILAMSIMQACLASGIVLLQARQIGVIRRLRLTPLRTVTILGSFLTGRLLVVALHLVVLVLVAVLGFGVVIHASWIGLFLALIIGTATFMALGLAVAVSAPSIESASLLVQALSLPMSFLCGVFFKVESMPDLLQWLPRVLPLTYLVDTLRGMVTLGLPLSHFYLPIGVLAGWLVVSLGICAFSFRYWQREGA